MGNTSFRIYLFLIISALLLIHCLTQASAAAADIKRIYTGSKACLKCHEEEYHCIGCHMPPVGKRAVKGDVHSHKFTVIGPDKTLNMGGDIDSQPNSCNMCHYHWNDSPEKMRDVLKAIKKQGTGS